MNVNATQFGERLRMVRKMRGYTQDELSHWLHMSDGAVGKYERGVTSPDINNLYLIGKKLNVSIDFLLGLRD